jgi:DNA modification methylase
MTGLPLGTARVIRGNARNIPLPDDSVDLIVTSPPYFSLRSYQDGGEHYEGQIGDEATPAEFVNSLLEVTRECIRVLNPGGSLFVNLGDKYSGYNNGSGKGRSLTDETRAEVRMRDLDGSANPAAYGAPAKSLIGIPWRYAIACVDDLDLILRAEMIWEKPNGLPESVTDRVRRSHEQWFHFTVNQKYYANVDPIREPHATAPSGGRPVEGHPLGKLPNSVWNVATEPLRVPQELGIDHFAAFPTEWPKRLIQAFCPEGGTVLDPFGGTGTTAMVAKALGRDGISLDMSADYCRLAQWRTNDRDQLAKVLGIAKVDKPAEDQMSLFGPEVDEDGSAA